MRLYIFSLITYTTQKVVPITGRSVAPVTTNGPNVVLIRVVNFREKRETWFTRISAPLVRGKLYRARTPV